MTIFLHRFHLQASAYHMLIPAYFLIIQFFHSADKYFLPSPLLALLQHRQSSTEETLLKLSPMKRNQRINITLSRNRPVEHDRTHRDYDSHPKSPEIKQARQNQNQHSHKFERISQFKARLTVIGNRHKRHIKHRLRIEPP